MRNGSFFGVEPGVELYYEVSGDGPPLIFVPGWTFSTEVFDYQVAHFSKTHRVVSFDPRSQGRSTVTVHGNDYSTQSTDLCKLLDYLDLQRPVLVGWSYGCLPLWGAVRLRGTEPFKAFVFIDMPPAPVTGRDDEWTEMSVAQAAEFYQALTSTKGHRDLVTAYAQKTMMQKELSTEEFDWIVGLSTRTPCWAAAAYDAAGNFSNYQREAEKVDRALPTLFIVAECSRDRAKQYLQTRLPNAKAEFFGGHMMFWEFPERFNAILEDFLQTCDS